MNSGGGEKEGPAAGRAAAGPVPEGDPESAAERILASKRSHESVSARGAAGGSGNALPSAPIEGGVGLGVDLVSIARIERVLGRTPRFVERVYTAQERAYCDGTSRPAVHYATRFAAKEAVLKALGTGFSHGIAPIEVEVVRQGKGRPVVKLHGKAASVAAQAGVRDIPLSLSFTHDDAVACAMAITNDSVRAAEERRDPMEELSRQFKETRSLLDQIPAHIPPADPKYPAMAQLEAARAAHGEKKDMEDGR